MTITGKAVLVTGASAGIGRAAAIGAAKAGADVAINYLDDDDAAASCIAAIEAEGRRGIAIRGDVALADDTLTTIPFAGKKDFGILNTKIARTVFHPSRRAPGMPRC